ncbi:hypothetical protein [Methylocystis sp. H4A]|uniref:hypothetical protein n=1 Tax=Methylocystis sp. H4A TaxID=2785788 RepID=UPI0032B17CEF
MERERAKAALERIKVQLAPQITLEPDQVERFGAFMREHITTGDTTFRKAYLRSIVDAVEVDDKVIRIHGSKASLEQAVIAGEQIGKGVRSYIRKWRAHGDSNPEAVTLSDSDRSNRPCKLCGVIRVAKNEVSAHSCGENQ